MAIAQQPTHGPTHETEGQAPWTDVARTGPGTMAGRYLRTFWHPIWRSADLPPGRARPLRVMSEDFTLYRGESADGHEGQAHLVAFRCAHRGTQLSTGWVEGEEIRCFYHGWKYDGSGQCTEQPAEPEPFCQRIRIRSYPVREYLGLIFAYLGDGEPPDLPRYTEFEEEGLYLSNGAGGGEDAEDDREGPPAFRPCNYFNRLENSPDPVHLAFVHKKSPFTDSGLVGIPQPSGMETDYGIEVRAQRPNGKVRITQFHMPNINNRPAPDGHIMTWRIPIDDESCMSFTVSSSHHAPVPPEVLSDEPKETIREVAERILRGEMHVDDVTENLVGVQDWVAQVGQGAIAPRELDHNGRSDVLVVLLRRLYERELRALAEGRPLKHWHRAGDIETAWGA